MNFENLTKLGFKESYDKYSGLTFYHIDYSVKNQYEGCTLSIDKTGLVQVSNDEVQWIGIGTVNSVSQVKKLYLLLTGKDRK